MAGFFEKIKAHKPKLSETSGDGKAKIDIPDDLWVKCSNCSALIYKKTFLENIKVCEKCGFHHKLSARERVEMLVDEGAFREFDENLSSADPLVFGNEYLQKLKFDQEKTGLKDGVLSGYATIGSIETVLAVMDFNFRGGSMGSVVGEKITRVLEKGADEKIPVITVNTSGGARMQEGMLSLMQMAKTSAAVGRLNKAAVPYISVHTDPTMAGVAASFASLADIIIAEPGAIIGFSGARVIEQTIRQKLPPGFQTSEFHIKHGMLDKVVPRKNLKETIIKILRFFL